MKTKLVFESRDFEIPPALAAFRVFASTAVMPKHYHCGTIEGIYADAENGKDIIAIFNAEPHNGHFEMFIKELERYAHRTGEKVAICSFFNEGLYWHIRKRKGWDGLGQTMDRLEYRG